MLGYNVKSSGFKWRQVTETHLQTSSNYIFSIVAESSVVKYTTTSSRYCSQSSESLLEEVCLATFWRIKCHMDGQQGSEIILKFSVDVLIL